VGVKVGRGGREARKRQLIIPRTTATMMTSPLPPTTPTMVTVFRGKDKVGGKNNS
jgi:hypothetical protein